MGSNGRQTIAAFASLVGSCRFSTSLQLFSLGGNATSTYCSLRCSAPRDFRPNPPVVSVFLQIALPKPLRHQHTSDCKSTRTKIQRHISSFTLCYSMRTIQRRRPSMNSVIAPLPKLIEITPQLHCRFRRHHEEVLLVTYLSWPFDQSLQQPHRLYCAPIAFRMVAIRGSQRAARRPPWP